MADLLDGRYLLHERLGGGAFGTVHRAELRVLGRTLRQVAVKLPRPDTALTPDRLVDEAARMMRVLDRCPDPQTRDRFLDCHDAGVERDAPNPRGYLAMELARGDLEARLHGARHPAGAVLDTARQICRGVAHLHREGLLHLDLKPGNVLVSVQGTLKIGDFGTAARVDTLLRRAAVPGGTVAYQPPETLQLRDSGPGADVYAIGLICYRMLTGALPYGRQLAAAGGGPGRAPDLDAMIRLKLRDPVPPGRDNPEVRGHPLEEVVLRAVSPMATDRYPDAAALLHALDAATGKPPHAGARAEPAGSQPVTGEAHPPEHLIADLLAGALAALRGGSPDTAADLADRAVRANRELPDSGMVAEVYPLAVRVSLLRGETAAARALAVEGLGRRRCAATSRAMADAYAGTDLGRGFTDHGRPAAREGTAR